MDHFLDNPQHRIHTIEQILKRLEADPQGQPQDAYRLCRLGMLDAYEHQMQGPFERLREYADALLERMEGDYEQFCEHRNDGASPDGRRFYQEGFDKGDRIRAYDFMPKLRPETPDYYVEGEIQAVVTTDEGMKEAGVPYAHYRIQVDHDVNEHREGQEILVPMEVMMGDWQGRVMDAPKQIQEPSVMLSDEDDRSSEEESSSLRPGL